MTEIKINGKWPLRLPEHRASRPELVNGWEVARLDSMNANLRPGMTVFDIGAEEGDLPALWATWGCSVVMVEPGRRVWRNIKAVWQGNNLRPLGWFVGFASDADVMPNAAAGWNAAIDVWPRCANGDVIEDHGFCNVYERPDIPQVTIDTLSETFVPPEAITIDVEGAELRVLQGAAKTIARHRPLLWISVHPTFLADQYRTRVSDIWRLLEGHGYEWRLLDYDHELHVFAWHVGRDPKPELPTP